MVEQTPADKAVICDTPNATPTEGDNQAMPLTSASAAEESAPVSPAPGSETDVAKALNNIAPAAGAPEATAKQPSPDVCEVPQGKQEATPEMIAGAVTIHKPDAGQTVNYQVANGQNYNLDFSTKDSIVETQGDNLVIRFADGSVIVLEHFDTTASNSKLIVDGCEAVSGTEFTKMAGLANSLNEIAPAAGGQPAGPQGNSTPGNSGASFGQFADSGLPAGPNALGPLGATALTYKLIDGLTPEGDPFNRIDGKPSISLETPLNTVDETGGGGAGGVFTTPRTNGGTFSYDLGPDGAGSVRLVDGPSGLTHHGEVITTTISADGLTATGTTPGGEVIFTYTIDPATSTYVFTEYGSLDHPDPTNPNEALDLPFTIRVTDADGDTADGVAIIRVLDDAPTAVDGGTVTVDETSGSHLTAGGTINFNYGGDGEGSIKLVGGPTTTLTSHGEPVTVSVTDNVVTGTAGGVTVFTLTLNPATGEWTYNQTGSLDHPDHSNPNDALNLGFTIRVTDYDGDHVDTAVNVTVLDDGPKVDASSVTVDETGGFDTVHGSIGLNYGADGAGSFTITTLPTGLTSHGSPVTITLSADGLTATGTTVDMKTVAIFTLTIDPVTGAYTFTQLASLDHPDHGNPNDALNLGFGFTATDGDGDSVSSTLNVTVLDDGPKLDAGNVTVDETGGFDTVHGTIGLNYGADGAGSFTITTLPTGLTAHGQPVTVTLSADGHTAIGTTADMKTPVFTLTIDPSTGAYTFTQSAALDHPDHSNPNDALNLGFGFTATDGDGDSVSSTLTVTVLDDGPTAAAGNGSVDETGGFDTIHGSFTAAYGQDGPGNFQITGLPVNLTSHGVVVDNVISADGHTISGVAGGVTVFTLTFDTTTGTYTFTQSAALDHPTAGDSNDALNLGFTFTVTDGDGDSASATLNIQVLDDGPSASASNVTVDETGGFDTAHGTITASFGQDGAGTVSLTTLPTGLTAHGQPVTVTLSADGLTATGTTADMKTPVFTLTIDPVTGSYTFTQTAALDHPDASNPNDALNLGFGFTVTDHDGDTATATLNVTVLDDAPTGGAVTITGTGVGDAPATGTLPYAYGADSNGSIKLSGSVNGLTSGGQPVTVTVTDGSAVGKLADGTVVFTLTLTGGNHYSYSQNLNLDGGAHINIGYTVTDGDGDTAPGTITIDTKSDGLPTACDAVNVVDETGGFDTVGGTLTHTFGPDGAGDVKFTSGPSGLSSHGVPVTSTVSADGLTVTGTANGVTVFTATVNPATGAYTFTQLAALDHPNASNPNDALKLGFGFTVTDHDGDHANATLTVTVLDDGPSACVVNTSVDETGGFDSVSGNLSFSYGQDGAGSVTLTAGPSGVTSHGVSVVNNVSADGHTITGTAGGVTVYTLTLNPATGAYTFTQMASLDHHDTHNANDVLSLGFGYTVKDFDGDSANGSLCVSVYDDGPSIKSVHAELDESDAHDSVGPKNDGIWADANHGTPLAATGKVVFSYGADGAGSVHLSSAPSDLTHHGQAVGVVISGSTATGTLADGTLVFTLSLDSATGIYTYKQYASLDHGDTHNNNEMLGFNFGIQVTDGDGDSANGNINLCISDDGPCATASCLNVNQSNLHDDCNPCTPLFSATSQLDFGYGNDGKGKVTLTDMPCNLYSHGQLITSVLVGNMITGKLASGETVYTLELDGNTGKYTYKQYGEIDTAGSSHTELNIGYKVVDGDGDTAKSSIKIDVTGDICHPHQPPVICVSVDQHVVTQIEHVTFNHAFNETRTWEGFPAESVPVDKVLIGMTSANLEIGGNYTLPADLTSGVPQHMVSITYEGEGAGYSNTLGWFVVGPNGEMSDAKIAIQNSDGMAIGTKVDLGYVPAGSEIEFFIVPNGAQLNNYGSYAAGGSYQFWSGGAPGSAGAHMATVNDAANSIKLFYVNGSSAVEVLTAQQGVYFATHDNLNQDGIDHIISGVDAAHPGDIYMGFEDLNKTSTDPKQDYDYNDLVFRVSVGPACGTVVKTCADINITAGVTDPDSTHLSSAVVHLTTHLAGDKIDLGGDFTLSGHNVLNHGVDTGVIFTQGTDGGFSLSGSASLSTYQAILSAAELHNTNGTISGERELTFQVTDDTGLASNVATVDLSYADNTDNDSLSYAIKEMPVSHAGDVYIFKDSPNGSCDTIVGFNHAQGDKLDVNQVLEGHNGSMKDLCNYIKVEADGAGNTVVQVDNTGSGHHFEALASLHGVTGVTLEGMVSDGSLDVGRFLNS